MIFDIRETVFSEHEAVFSYLSIFAYLSKRIYQKNLQISVVGKKEMKSKTSKWPF